jgi:formylglycine-generating enzyme required for sulfatase activity
VQSNWLRAGTRVVVVAMAFASILVAGGCGSGEHADSAARDAAVDRAVEDGGTGLDTSVSSDSASHDASDAGDATVDATQATDANESADSADASDGATYCAADASGPDAAAHSYPDICETDLSCNYGDPAFDPCNPSQCLDGLALCVPVRTVTGFGSAPDGTPCDDRHSSTFAYSSSAGCPSNTCTGGANDGAACTSDAQCPGGSCFMDRCVDGPNKGAACSTNADCTAGAPNVACVQNNTYSAHCDGGAENGNTCRLICVGGDYAGLPCRYDAECYGTVNGTCSSIPNSPDCPPAGKCVRWTADAATGTCRAVASNPFCNTVADCPTSKYCALDPRNQRGADVACIGEFETDDCCDGSSWGPCLVWDSCDTVHHVCARTRQGGQTVSCGAATVYKYGDEPCGLATGASVGTVCNDVCMAGRCTSRFATCGSACTNGASRCSGNAIETCGPTGLWSSAVACTADAPTCVAGVCLPLSRDAGGESVASCLAGGAGLSNCGAGGYGSESCCTSLDVPGGTYDRTYTNSGDGGTAEADPASVSNFRLDKYLVTVGRFRQFVRAWNGGAGYVPPAGSGKHSHLNGGNGLNRTIGGYEPGWLASDDAHVAPTDANLACDPSYATWTTAPSGAGESRPINCVNWYEAYAFCTWDGGFLPSEAEWEYAAAGGSEQREYPWGSASPGTGNQYAVYGCFYPGGSGSCADVTNVAPVGTPALGSGRFGQLDLAGDVWEWNLDAYASPFFDPCTDCASFATGQGPVSHGGDFSSGTLFLASARRGYGSPLGRGRGGGIRCARAPLATNGDGGVVGVCTPGATQCSGNAVETCDATGQWQAAVPCGASAPVCAAGACTAASLDGGVLVPASCLPFGAGKTDCGPGGTGNESCCTSLEVAGGTFDRTYINSGDGGTGLADPATVSGFRLDKYLVTVGRFRAFVGAWNGGGGYLPPAGSGKHAHLNGGQGLMNVAADAAAAYETGWLASDDANVAPTDANLGCDPTYATWTSAASPTDNLPINCINWYEAYAFCIWDGGFLPSDAEEAYAGAGGSEQREYPWGTTTPGTSSQYAIYGCLYPNASGNCLGEVNLAPVGTASLGAGLWGQLDLVGELYEWTMDWFVYPRINPCIDCAVLTPGSERVLRGTTFDLPASYLVSSTGAETAVTRYGKGGFRCARTP